MAESDEDKVSQHIVWHDLSELLDKWLESHPEDRQLLKEREREIQKRRSQLGKKMKKEHEQKTAAAAETANSHQEKTEDNEDGAATNLSTNMGD